MSLKNFITFAVSFFVQFQSCCCQNVLAFSHSRGLSSGKSMRHDIEETNTSFPAVNDSNSQLWGFVEFVTPGGTKKKKFSATGTP